MSAGAMALLLLLWVCTGVACGYTFPVALLSRALAASLLAFTPHSSLPLATGVGPLGNLKQAIMAVMDNSDSALCTLDTMLVDDYHGSCQQLDNLVRVRAGKVFTIRQDWGGSASTGAAVWNGANMVAWYMENVLGRASLEGKSFLELGAGVGFDGLIACSMGSTDVVISDGNEDVLKLAEENIEINIAEARRSDIRTGRLRWNTDDEKGYLVSPVKQEPWDYIVAADVTYLKKNRADLMASIAHLSGPKTVTLLSMEPRNVDEVADVLGEVERAGLHWREERLPVDPEKSQCSLLCARMFLLTK